MRLTFLRKLERLFFSESCSICQKQGNLLCSNCLRRLQRNLPECHVCRRISNGNRTHKKCLTKNPTLLEVLPIWKYTNEAKIIMKTMKYQSAYKIIEPIMEYIAQDRDINKFFSQKDDAVITPIPLHINKKRERGYNQTEEIAKYLSKLTRIKYDFTLIERIKYTESQAKLDIDAREKNIKNTFSVQNQKIKLIKNIILLDDVITTGFTMNEAAKALKSANSELKIYGVALFRGKPMFKKEL